MNVENIIKRDDKLILGIKQTYIKGVVYSFVSSSI